MTTLWGGDLNAGQGTAGDLFLLCHKPTPRAVFLHCPGGGGNISQGIEPQWGEGDRTGGQRALNSWGTHPSPPCPAPFNWITFVLLVYTDWQASI